MLVHLHHVFSAALVASFGVLTLGLLHFLAQIILRGVAQILHQPRDFFLVGAIFHRLTQPLLRGAHSLQRITQIPILKQDTQIPKCLRNLVTLDLVQPVALRHRLELPYDDPQPQIGLLRAE